jgi:dTDP-4-amino-4,6-dideoxygalactose transaminase
LHENLPFALPDISRAEIAAVTECLESGWLTSGRKVQEFEAAFARTVKCGHAIAINSATAGCLLALDALGVGPGTEVVVPAMTFSGPAMMAHRLGAKVVLADCEEGSYQISVDDVASKITPQTRVVMPTHFGGASCRTEALGTLCYKHGISWSTTPPTPSRPSTATRSTWSVGPRHPCDVLLVLRHQVHHDRRRRHGHDLQ